MKVIALVILLSAWGCLLFAPAGTASRVLQRVVFGALGALLTLTGSLLRAVLGGEGGADWPEPKSRQRPRGR